MNVVDASIGTAIRRFFSPPISPVSAHRGGIGSSSGGGGALDPLHGPASGLVHRDGAVEVIDAVLLEVL
jgi:hypothetical protein